MELATSTLEAIQRDIDQAEYRLAQKRITPTFGQREVRRLVAKYSDFIADYWSPDARRGLNLIKSFERECRTYRGALR